MLEKIRFRKIGRYSQDQTVFQGMVRIFQVCFPTQAEVEIDYLVRMIRGEMRHGHRYIVVQVNNRIAGFVSWRVWGEPRHQLAELYHIAVHPDFAGQGLGRFLVDRLIKTANRYYQKYGLAGLRKLFVLTHALNKPAQKFYRSVGFKKVAVLPNFFRQNVDECVLAMDFQKT